MYNLNLENALVGTRYRIRRRLRCGSFTELFLGFDEVAHQVVILKALNVALKGTLDDEFEQKLIAYFHNEAEVLGRLQHPHIIKRLGQGTAVDGNGRAFEYLVLEYMPGGDLMTLCRQHPLPLARALQYCRQVCLGLAYAHHHGIIHRDIKPQNLLLDAERRRVKISDFGIAKVLRGDDDEITRGIGTESYAPPECFGYQDNDPPLTPAADVYGLAKTLYVMVTGESPREFFQRPITSFPKSILAQPWAAELLPVLTKATQHEPEQRYRTVDAFWRDLERLVPASVESDHCEPDEETVITISLGQFGAAPASQRAQASRHSDLASAMRLEVPLKPPASEQPPPSLQSPMVGAQEPVLPTPTVPPIVTPPQWTRRLFTLGLAASFIVAAFWVHSIVSGPSARVRSGVATANLHLRAEPRVTSVSYGLILKGASVKITGVSSDGRWYEVEAVYRAWSDRRLHDGRGWVAKSYIELDQEYVR